AFSADVWTLAATVLSNIILTWLVLLPLLMFFLMLPRLFPWLLSLPQLTYSDVIFVGAIKDYGAPALDAVSGSLWVRYAVPGLSSLLFATALFNTMRYLPGLGNRDHSPGDYLQKSLLPLVGAVLTFLMFDSLYFLGTRFAHYSNLSSVVWWI